MLDHTIGIASSGSRSLLQVLDRTIASASSGAGNISNAISVSIFSATDRSQTVFSLECWC